MYKLLVLCCFLSGCSLLQRSRDSGYANKKNSGQQKILKSYQPTASKDFSDRAKLQILENSLGSKKEIEQYSKMLPWFESDQEKIQFLMLGSFEEKQKWLNEKSFLQRPQQTIANMEELVQAQDIAVGMPQSLVKRSWGEPDLIEVSGSPQFKNERWRYNKYISTPDGYKAERKVVYFEGGKVVGWELE